MPACEVLRRGHGRGAPAEVAARLNPAVNPGLRDAEIRPKLAGLGATAMPGAAAEFGRFVASETARYADAVRLAGIRPG